MGAEQKKIASEFFSAFVLGDVNTAAEVLDPGVEFVRDNEVLAHGIAALAQFVAVQEKGEMRCMGKPPANW